MADIHFLGCFENNARLTLENVREKIDAGEVETLCIAGTLKNGDVISAVLLSSDRATFSLLGILDAVKHRVIGQIEPPAQVIYPDGSEAV